MKIKAPPLSLRVDPPMVSVSKSRRYRVHKLQTSISLLRLRDKNATETRKSPLETETKLN